MTILGYLDIHILSIILQIKFLDIYIYISHNRYPLFIIIY
jgi:hypothetical protein